MEMIVAVCARYFLLPGRNTNSRNRYRASNACSLTQYCYILNTIPYWIDPDTHLDRDYPPEHGTENPFLHMSLHMTIEEQLSIDNPTGIRQHFNRLLQSHRQA